MKNRSDHIRRMYLAGEYSYSFALYSLDALGMTEQAAHSFLTTS